VSLTLTPMMCAYLLKHTPVEKQGKFYHASEEMFNNIIKRYGQSLQWVLKHQKLTLGVALGTLVFTVLLYVFIPKGFFPIQDTGIIQGISEGPQSISFPLMAKRQQQLAAVILKDPAVESLSTFIGVDGTNTTLNSGRILINLKDIDVRKINASDVIRRLQKSLASVKGITLYMQPVQDLTVDDTVSRTQYQYTLEDPNADELNVWAPKLVDALNTLPQLRDVGSDEQARGLQESLVIDRATASRLGVTPSVIDNTLYSAYGQRIVSTIFTQLNQYRVILEVQPDFKKNPNKLHNLYVRGSNSAQVPLDVIAKFSQTTGPLIVGHLGQFPAVTLSFNLAPGASLGDAVAAIQATTKQIGLPDSISGQFQGTAQAFQSSLSNEPILILAALITVYIVLGVLYESYIHPITILSTLPSAGVGAILSLLIFRTDLSVIALIGIILLIGIVKKNGIMMVDFALDAEREEGKAPEEAIYQSCLLRFRPIMMTTMSALLAAVPLAFGGGMGSELRQPLGITIIGGLIFSQVLTLYTTPVIYLWFDRVGKRLGLGTKK